MNPNEKTYLYEAESDDFLLTEDEEKIMRTMRKVNKLWQKYQKNHGANRLILFGNTMRINDYSYKNIIESYPHIVGDGGDGGDDL